jgi:hypothetical protein
VLVGLLHVHLHEGAGQLLLFPGRRCLAGAKPNDDVLPAHGLTGVQGYVLNDPVALVEDPQNRDALRHRRHTALSVSRRRDPLPRQWSIRQFASLATRGERERDEQRCGDPAHAYSGIHGS